MPPGPYPQFALCGHVGNAPTRIRMRTMMRMVDNILLPKVPTNKWNAGKRFRSFRRFLRFQLRAFHSEAGHDCA